MTILSRSNNPLKEMIMKRNSFLKLGLIGLLALAISGCNGFEEQKLPDEKVSPDEPFSIIVSPETKTQMSGDNDVVWKDDDAITVFVASKGSSAFSKNYKFERKTTGYVNSFYCNDFVGVLDAQNDWYVFYPYTATIGTPKNNSVSVIVGSAADGSQTQAGNSSRAHLAGDNIPLYGKGTFDAGVVPTIILDQALSVIKVHVTNNTANDLIVSSVSFTAPEAIVGSFAIDFSGSNPAFTPEEGDNMVSATATLTVNNGAAITKGESADFYLAIKPFTAVEDDILLLAVNGETKKLKLSKEVTFNRGNIKTLNFSYDYSLVNTTGSDVTLTGGTNSSEATVNGYNAIKIGTSKAGGDMTITVPKNTTRLYIHAAAWNGVTDLSLNITSDTEGVSVDPSSIALTANTGIASNSPFTLGEGTYPSEYYHEIELNGISDETTLTFTSGSKRLVLWGANVEIDDTEWQLKGIAVKNNPTKTVYEAGETLVPDGLVITATYEDKSGTKDDTTRDIAYSEATESNFSFDPYENLQSSENPVEVTVTYKGKNEKFYITVSDPQLAFTNISGLNDLAGEESAEYSGSLEGAVVSYVPDENNAIIKDETGSILLNKNNHGLLQGQTFTGNLHVTVALNNSCARMTECDADFEGNEEEISPAQVTIADLIGNLSTYQNAYVRLSDLSVTGVNNKNVTVSDGNVNTYHIYSSAANATCQVGDIINVIGTVGHYTGGNSDYDQVRVWSANNIIITSPRTITFSQSEGGSFIVKNNSDDSDIVSGNSYPQGTVVRLEATADNNYEFTSWTVTGAELEDETDNPLVFTVGSSNVAISANFTSTIVTKGSYWGYTFNSNVFSNKTANLIYNSKTLVWSTSIDPAGYTNEALSFGTNSLPAAANMSTSSYTDGISNVVISIKGNSKKKVTASVSVGGTALKCNGNTSVTQTGNVLTDYQFTSEDLLTGQLVISFTDPDGGYQIKTIKINVEPMTLTLSVPSAGGESIAATVGTSTTTATTADATTQVMPGATVSLTANPSTGYQFDSWTVCKTGDESTVVEVSNNAFTMPDYPVTVSASFEQIQYYTLTWNAPSNGSITVKNGETTITNGASVPAGATINITATPADGYALSTLVYNDGSAHDIKSAKSFTMPSQAVTITATFEQSGGTPTEYTDILTASMFAATSTTYTDFSGVSYSGTNHSASVYAGNSAKDSNGNIQLRSKNSNSGIVSTTSGGKVKSIKITVGSGSNTIDVYGSSTAYSAASDLYGTSKGTKIGSVSATGTITVPDNVDYSFVGIRSNNGAVYITSIEITWED